MFYPLVGASTRFSPSFDFVMDTCGKVNIHFVLFEFVGFFAVRSHEVLLDYMGTHNGDPMGITLLKFPSPWFRFSFLKPPKAC